MSHALPPPGGDYDADADGDEDDEDAGFGDDFDDFEEGDEDAEFGDFDDGFQEAGAQPVQSLPQIASLSLVSDTHTHACTAQHKPSHPIQSHRA